MTTRNIMADFIQQCNDALVRFNWSPQDPVDIARVDRAIDEARMRRNEALSKLNKSSNKTKEG